MKVEVAVLGYGLCGRKATLNSIRTTEEVLHGSDSLPVVSVFMVFISLTEYIYEPILKATEASGEGTAKQRPS